MKKTRILAISAMLLAAMLVIVSCGPRKSGNDGAVTPPSANFTPNISTRPDVVIEGNLIKAENVVKLTVKALPPIKAETVVIEDRSKIEEFFNCVNSKTYDTKIEGLSDASNTNSEKYAAQITYADGSVTSLSTLGGKYVKTPDYEWMYVVEENGAKEIESMLKAFLSIEDAE